MKKSAKRTTTTPNAREDLQQHVKAFIAAHPDYEHDAQFLYLRSIVTYSDRNIILILTQCDERGIDPLTLTDLRGYETWRDAGRQVRKGIKSFSIFAPIPTKKEKADPEHPAESDDHELVACTIVHVFDISATDAMDIEQIAKVQQEKRARHPKDTDALIPSEHTAL